MTSRGYNLDSNSNSEAWPTSCKDFVCSKILEKELWSLIFLGPCGLAAARQALRRMTRCLCARPAAAPRAGAPSPRRDARGAHGTTGPSRGSSPSDCLPYWPAVKCLRGKHAASCPMDTAAPAAQKPTVQVVSEQRDLQTLANVCFIWALWAFPIPHSLEDAKIKRWVVSNPHPLRCIDWFKFYNSTSIKRWEVCKPNWQSFAILFHICVQ